jgi:autotransporter-associated beta strand protein
MKKLLILIFHVAGIFAYALPTYEPFTEYSSLVAGGGGFIDLATSGYYVTNGSVIEQWGGGASGFGLFFKTTGADIMVTNNPASVFTSENLAAILPSSFPGAEGSINVTAYIPQNQGANNSGNSAVLEFAQDIVRPSGGAKSVYMSYLLDVTGNFNGATGSGNVGRYGGFLSRTNILEGSGSGGTYTTWASLFNAFGASPNYVSYGYKINSPTISSGDDILAADSSGANSPSTGNVGVGAVYNTANFVVGCFTFSSSFNDTNTVWVNPPIADFGGPTPSSANFNSFKMSSVMSDVDAFFLESRSGGASGGIGPTFIGNLLIGTTWSYVTGGPEFTNSPTNVIITAYGSNLTLSGSAVAAAQTVAYQWQKIVGGSTNNLVDGVGTAGGTANVSGSQSQTLSLNNVSAGDTGQYQLMATASGTGFSLAAPVNISYDSGPIITQNPSSAATNYGATATFTAAAESPQGSMSYQWYFGSTPLVNGMQADGSIVSGAVGTVATDSFSATLTIANVTYLEDGNYSVVATNNVDAATQSSAGILSVYDPFIVTQPTNTPITILLGGSGSVSVVAVGTSLTYQWYGVEHGRLSNAGDFSGVTTATLAIANAQSSDVDSYYVSVSGASGQSVTSSSAAVYVKEAAAETLNVMPFGGSIVAGQSAQTPYQGGGFRTGLYLSLAGDTRFIPNMVGSSTALLANSPTNVNPLTTANQLHHEGHPGWTTLMMLANINGDDGTSGGDGGYWLTPGNGVNPNTILVNIGGNDAVDYGTDPASMTSGEERMDATISGFNTLRPGVNTIISSICYRGDDGGAYSAGLDPYFNPLICGTVFNHVLAGQSVGYLDLRSIMNYPSDIGSDNIHPTQAGYNKMAGAWYQSMIYGSAYWTGNQNGVWNTINGNSSNWALDGARTQDRQKSLNDPAAITFDIYPDVFFNSNSGPLSTTLGADTTIRSLNFTKGATGPVTIGAGNTLTIGSVDTSVTLSTPYSLINCGGITVQAGSGSHILAANVILGADQTWGNVSSNSFTVSGSVSGTNCLAIAGAYTFYNPGVYTPDPSDTKDATYTTVATNYAGTGAVVLVGNNSYSGGTIVNSGVLVVNGQSAPNSGTGSGPVMVNAGGTLSGNGCIVGPVTVANASNAALYPNIDGGGVLTLGGNLTFSGSNADAKFNLGGNNTSGNDQVVLENKTLACGGAQITISNTSAGGLSASDYVLFNAGSSGAISGSFNSKPIWSGTPPKNSSQYGVLTVGNTVVLRFYPIEATQIGMTNGNVVVIRFSGVPTNTYVVQMTTNLATPWYPVSTNIAGMDGSWMFQDSNIRNNREAFYRVVVP